MSKSKKYPESKIQKITKKDPVDRLKQYNTYMKLVYMPIFEIEKVDDEVYYNATIPEFPGLLGTGTNQLEAHHDLNEAKGLLIETLMKGNIPIPLPTTVFAETKVFISGQKTDRSPTSQPFQPFVFEFNQLDGTVADPEATKQLSSGVLWTISTKQRNFEKTSDTVFDYATSVTSSDTIGNRELIATR